MKITLPLLVLALLLPATLPASLSALIPEEASGKAPVTGRCRISNGRIALDADLVEGRIRRLTVEDALTGRTRNVGPDPFSLILSEEGKPGVISGSSLEAKVKIVPIAADPGALRLADKTNGTRLVFEFAAKPGMPRCRWTVELREDAPFLRRTLDVFNDSVTPVMISGYELFDFEADGAKREGTAKGVPVSVGGVFFCGVEHPSADNDVKEGRVTGVLKRRVPLGARRSFAVSDVFGVSEPGQLRRTFQSAYLNRERARPYALFVNYNTWYDLGHNTRYDEKAVLATVRDYGEELVRKRGVSVNSFLLDDGWDETATLWRFHAGFPDGFRNIAKLTAQYGAAPGVWFSPWGGYYAAKAARIGAAKKADPKIETNAEGFALSGPRYYKVFRDMCLRMIEEQGVNQFKFDGTGGRRFRAAGKRIRQRFRRGSRADRRSAPGEAGHLRESYDGHLALSVLVRLRRFDLAGFE